MWSNRVIESQAEILTFFFSEILLLLDSGQFFRLVFLSNSRFLSIFIRYTSNMYGLNNINKIKTQTLPNKSQQETQNSNR